MTRNNLCIISISLGFNTETMSTPYVFLVEYTLNDPIYIILEIEIFRNNCVSNSPYVSEQISVHYVSLSTLLYVLQA